MLEYACRERSSMVFIGKGIILSSASNALAKK